MKIKTEIRLRCGETYSYVSNDSSASKKEMEDAVKEVMDFVSEHMSNDKSFSWRQENTIFNGKYIEVFSMELVED